MSVRRNIFKVRIGMPSRESAGNIRNIWKTVISKDIYVNTVDACARLWPA